MASGGGKRKTIARARTSLEVKCAVHGGMDCAGTGGGGGWRPREGGIQLASGSGNRSSISTALDAGELLSARGRSTSILDLGAPCRGDGLRSGGAVSALLASIR